MGFVIRDEPDVGAVMSLYGISGDEVAAREAFQRPTGRWFAYDDDEAVGVATAFVRPDDRLFVVHRLTSEDAFAPLLDAAVAGVRRDAHVTVDRAHDHRSAAARALGFTTELDSVAFAVPFGAALETAGRLRRPTRFDLRRSDEIDVDDLFELDTTLRQDIPGNDGWRGNRIWFDDELTSPEHDPTAYLVARDPATSDLVGLVRFWRNDDGPALGMLGVRREHRFGSVATALLDDGLRTASTWGSPSFTTHTAHRSLQRRLRRLGAAEVGGFVRLRRVAR